METDEDDDAALYLVCSGQTAHNADLRKPGKEG